MAFTAPLTVPLTKGLDLSKDAALGTDDLAGATNVDYSKPGVVRGRPGRAAPLLFAPHTHATGNDVQYSADGTFQSTGFASAGLERLLDAASERPVLACYGRLFSQEGTRWNDRGPFACARVDRLVNYMSGLDQTQRGNAAQDFGLSKVETSGGTSYLFFDLLDSNGAVERTVRVSAGSATAVKLWGGNARCDTTTAVLGVGGTGNSRLHFFYRAAGGDTVTRVELATDARVPTDIGDAPAICCSSDAPIFFVVYRTTTADQYKVLRVSTTGAVLTTFTGTFTGLAGVWLDNTAVATDKLAVALTGTNGLRVKVFTAGDLTDNAIDSDYNVAGAAGQDVVIGVESATAAFWCYRSLGGSGHGDLVVGKVSLVNASSAELLRTYFADNTGIPRAGIRWSIGHQPIKLGGRVYLTLVAATNDEYTGTWVTLDLSNTKATTLGTGPFTYATLVARGPTEGTVPYTAPGAAVALSDGTGWTFPTLDWARFDEDEGGSAAGVDAQQGLTRVTLSKPRSALFGQSTVFSGSIPHVVQRGQSAELGFPFLGGVPGLDVTAGAGGAVGIGSYGVTAMWRWTDEAGQVHRSSPAAVRTCTIPGGGSNTITAYVTNPWLTEKEYGNVMIEVYTTADTGTPPAATGSYYLQATVAPSFTDAYTTVSINTQPVSTTEIVYTDGGVYANVHVPGDGGVAAVGRRLWLASANTLWASKLRVTGQGPGFNDSGALQVDLPSGVGRILALESMEDKLAVFCERGVYVIQDGGPDNIGQGPDFALLPISKLGVAGPRATVSLGERGIVFCAPFMSDPDAGGPWLLDRGLGFTYIGKGVRDYVDTADYATELAYGPERQQLFMTTSDGIAMFDVREGKWALWTVALALGTLQSIAVVGGVLWSLANEPAPYTRTDGVDSGAGSLTMEVRTSHLPASGRGGLGWSRVRGVRTLGTQVSQAHTLTIEAILDQMTTLTSSGISVSAPSAGSTWPTTRQAPEYRLPQQKCSTLQVHLSATPAVAEWAAIELEVVPLAPTGPARSRS